MAAVHRTGVVALLVALAACAHNPAPAQKAAAEPTQSEIQPVSGRMAVAQATPPADVKAALDKAIADARMATGGKNADYIPALAKVDPKFFSVVVVTADGEVYAMGDAEQKFSIQSIEKPFTAARDIEELGAQTVEKKIGVSATGLAFNSIVAIELQKESRPPPGNPLVNAGAIAAVSFVPAANADERWQKIIDNLSAFAGRSLTVDQEVYRSESETNTRNKAIAWLMTAYDSMGSDAVEALDLYTRACSVSVSAKDLAIMGATLASGGVNPVTHKKVVSPDTAARVLALMMTAGLYENSGPWAYEVGIPAKSGVGGGIVAVVPGRYAIATFAPPLDAAGNSVRGQAAIATFVAQMGGNVFAAPSRQGAP
jgi:glutaminase